MAQEKVVQDFAAKSLVHEEVVEEGFEEEFLFADGQGFSFRQSASVAFEVGYLDVGENLPEHVPQHLEILESPFDLSARGRGGNAIEDIVGHERVRIHCLVSGDCDLAPLVHPGLVGERPAFDCGPEVLV